MSRRTISEQGISSNNIIIDVALGSSDGLLDKSGHSSLRGVSALEHIIENGMEWSFFPLSCNSTYSPKWIFQNSYNRRPLTINFWLKMQPKQVNHNGLCMGYINDKGDVYGDDFFNLTVSGSATLGIQANNRYLYPHPAINVPTMVSAVFDIANMGKLYYNGELVATTDLNNQPAAAVRSIYGFCLGVVDFPRPHRFRKIKLYTDCLSGEDLKELYRSEK